MTDTLEALLQATGLTMAEVRPGEVCSKCKDRSICDQCPFHPPTEIAERRVRTDLPAANGDERDPIESTTSRGGVP